MKEDESSGKRPSCKGEQSSRKDKERMYVADTVEKDKLARKK